MAAQTVTTVVNYDDTSISGLLNGETITINGGSVTIDADVRWNQQEAVFGAVTLSATLGGSFLIDGTQIWEVPFSASTGNVPTQNALGSNGVTGGTSGATGELTRVWATGSLVPEAAGGAMPATGYIKLRSKTGTFQSGETITLPGGATVTASGAGKRSWINVVGREATALTIPRLGNFQVTGDWYELGTTDGTDDQVLQFPVADFCPSIWVETGSGTGVYEIWNNAADRWGVVVSGTPLVPVDVRGKFFGMDNATGVITIAKRAGSTSGFKPPSGCKVRIPNVILSSAPTTNYNANTIAAVVGTRYDFSTSSAGSVTMAFASCNWYLTAANPFTVTLTNCSFADNVALSNVAAMTTITNCGLAPTGTIAAGGNMSIANCFGGGAVTDCRFTRLNAATNASPFTLTDSDSFVVTRVQGDIFGTNTSSDGRTSGGTFAFFTSRLTNSSFLDCAGVGGGAYFSGSVNIICSGFQYADAVARDTNTTAAIYAFNALSGSGNVLFDGFSAFGGLDNVLPSAGIFGASAGCTNIELRNIGSSATPLDAGSALISRPDYLAATSVTVGLIIRRCYVSNFRGTTVGALSITNTTQNVRLLNVWSNGCPVATRLIGIDMQSRGCLWDLTNYTTGESAVYGHHWRDVFINSTDGNFQIAGHEPITATADQCSFTLDTALGSGFTSAGQISMTQTTDTVTWTMPYYAIGWTGIGKQLGGANAFQHTGTNPANFEYDYQIDVNDGAGFSAWKHLVSFARRQSGGTAGANTVAVQLADWNAMTRTPQVGDYVQGNANNFPAGTTITNIAVTTTVTLTLSNSVTVSNPTYIGFWSDIATETVSPVNGVKLKVRARVLTAAATNTFTFLAIPADTTATDYVRQYPLPTNRQGVITNIHAGSRLQIYNVTTSTEIVNTVVSGTSYLYDYNNGTGISDGDSIRIRLARCLGATASIGYEGITVASANGWSLFAAQDDDIVYNANGIDGTAVTEFNFDYPNIQVDINDPDGETTISRLYAWWANERTTEQGIRTLIGGLIAEDQANYKVVSSRINLKLDNSASTGVLFTGNLRLYRDDGAVPVVGSTSGGGSITLYADKVYVAETGTSGLTASESAKLDAITGIDQNVATVKKVLTNKRVTNPSTGQQIVYDDDNTTTLLSGAIYEDVAGTQPYRGQGVERADRLT